MTDTASVSVITDHPFTAAAWWALCSHCRLGMAAHRDVVPLMLDQREAEFAALDYRCPDCVVRGDSHCVNERGS